MTAKESKKVSLTCVVIGNPSPQVSWERLGYHSANLWDRTLVVTTEENSDYECVVKSTLNIMDVQPDIDLGNYKCTAKSSAGTDVAVIDLSGAFPSTIRNKDDNTEHALEGENVIFICEAYGKPSPTITWQQLRNQSNELDNGILVTQSEQRTVYRSLVTSTLIIAEVKPEMYNTTFSCIANNYYGTDRKDFHLKKPDPESRKKLGPAMISVAFIMLTLIIMILIFVIIRWRISRKNKHGQEQKKSQRGKNVNNSDPSSSIEEDKPYAELSNTGMETRKHDNMPLHETPMELADRSPPNV